MIKDIVVNLTGGHPQDFASAYAISLAAGFSAHLAGVGFIYEPVIPGSLLGGMPTDLIEAQREDRPIRDGDSHRKRGNDEQSDFEEH